MPSTQSEITHIEGPGAQWVR